MTVAQASDRELFDPVLQGRDPEQLAGHPRERLAESWRRVWTLPVPFYRAKFEAAGFGPDEVPPLDEIPRTTKSELRADETTNPSFGTHRAVSLEQAVRVGSSGGTTGSPTIYFYGPADLEAHVAVVTRNMWRHGLRGGMRFTHSWPQGIYPSALGGGRSYLDLGVLEIAVGLPWSPEVAAEHLRLWEVLRPDGFMMTGSQLQLYEQAGEDIGIDFGALLEGAILAFLEVGCQFEAPRRRLEDNYSVQLRNIGGASDVPGFAVSDCRYHTGMHAAGDHFVVQVCDPLTGRSLPAGERGTLVVTAFDIDAVAIRYDIEDLVVASTGPCPCGETGARYTLLGRVADAINVAGRTLLPLDVQLALDELGAPEFQMVKDGHPSKLCLRIEGEGSDGAHAAEAIQRRLLVSTDIELVEPGTLPRAAFKPRRVSG